MMKKEEKPSTNPQRNDTTTLACKKAWLDWTVGLGRPDFGFFSFLKTGAKQQRDYYAQQDSKGQRRIVIMIVVVHFGTNTLLAWPNHKKKRKRWLCRFVVVSVSFCEASLLCQSTEWLFVCTNRLAR
jgi:hypothetical protein